tara:strand:- start:1436 stop:1990 length:555 start_codon:yes stop_codon:yes gene_type:complete
MQIFDIEYLFLCALGLSVDLGMNREKPNESTLCEYENFERELINVTEVYYTQESSKFLSDNSVVDYLSKVESRIAEEEKRVEQYLHRDTIAPLNRILNSVLIEKHQEVLAAEFDKLLQDYRVEGKYLRSIVYTHPQFCIYATAVFYTLLRSIVNIPIVYTLPQYCIYISATNTCQTPLITKHSF